MGCLVAPLARVSSKTLSPHVHHIKRTTLKESSSFRNERDAVSAGIRDCPNPQIPPPFFSDKAPFIETPRIALWGGFEFLSFLSSSSWVFTGSWFRVGECSFKHNRRDNRCYGTVTARSVRNHTQTHINIQALHTPRRFQLCARGRLFICV